MGDELFIAFLVL